MRRPSPFLILGILLVVVAVAFSALASFVVDWLWFDALGFSAVFFTIWRTQVVVFAAAAALTALVLAINGLLAARMPASRVHGVRVITRGADGERLPVVVEFAPDALPWRLIVLVVAGVVGVFVGLAQAGEWQILQRWLHAVSFGRSDPVFGNDLSFYVFTLPLCEVARDWGFLIVFFAAALAGGVYWARGGIQMDERSPSPRLAAGVTRHLSILLAAFFLVKALDYVLQRYGLLFRNDGVVFGAGYTDVHLRVPLLTVLAGLSLLGAALCAANVRALGMRLPIAAVVLVFGASLLEGVVASVFQSYRVKPDELRLESPYIAQNIAFTRYGFALDRITSKAFPAAGTLSPAVLAANDATIQNIRWWDPRPLLDSYRQLQEMRLYYDFKDIDIDRYTLDGRYQQVMLSARELNQSRLPADAQTWINQRFKFTHGYGVAMNPVNRFDEEGLPHFYIKDIPPVSSVGLRIERPEVYFGEETRDYVVVGGGTTEFDYPKGQENVYTTYQGRDGVSLSSLWRRALFAWHVGDFKLLISGNVTAGSRILFRRLIQERIGRVAAFLALDRDPYLVVNNGRMIWVQDAYTTSGAVPYSQLTQQDGINYIRNAVKITVDAYEGTPTFYVSDPDDPLIRTYQRIFPTLFQPLEAMPAGLREHLRYPEDLFLVQANTYGTYHMTDPEVFYNKEDLWSFPQESSGGAAVTMQPYYTIMRLPGEAREEFILMVPMVPNGRDNMIAWLAARCDGAHYGTLIEYAFPKEKLIFGPGQIEARIDQDTTISQQLSLWNQTGSRVIRGNLLVIPIDDTLLYVEPLYLRAEKRELPELKRVIASAGDRVVMSQSVEPLLAALFGTATAPPAVSVTTAPAAGQPATGGDTTAAIQHYRQALEALRRGEWRQFGAEMDALRDALEAGATAP